MSIVAQDHVFLSALQPKTAVSTYAVPSEIQLGGNGATLSDEMTRGKRVQQQVAMRLAEKSSTLPRQNGSASHYTSSEHGGSSTMKYQTFNPGFSSKSYVYTGSRPVMVSGSPVYTASTPVMTCSRPVMVSGSPVYTASTPVMTGSRPPSPVAAWVAADVSDGCSLVSDRDATFSRQQSVYSTVSGGAYSSGTQMRQAGGGGIGGQGSMVPMRRSLSGTLAQSGGEMMVSSGSQGNLMTMQQQRQASLPRTMSVKSIHSVGKGMDIYDGPMGMTGSMGNLSGINNLDMGTAVRYLKEDDADMQVLGAAYIQHECYNNSDSKNQVRQYKAIPELVRLFNSENQEVARYATGAMRNVIYENMDNKMSLIEEGGIPQLINALKENDDELRKNITGILWNLSSKDNLKEKLAKETLAELTETILIPLSGSGDTEVIQQSPSEVDIFYNTTGCLRNLSSVNEKTRRQMRETNGLVDALVGYIQASVQDGKVEEKGVENSLCVLRNLSYQLYSEIPPSAQLRLEGPTRGQETSRSEAIGCFTPQSKKVKDRKNQDMATFTEVARVPKGLEWLWHPQVVGLYNSVLQGCENNSTTREAAAGALQNITAGDKRWAEVLSHVALEQERMLPVMLDKLRTNNDLELKSLTGFLRNLSRHAKDKNAMATKVVNNLVTELPADGQQKEPSSDVVVNICGTLNNLVTSSSIAARDIAFFDGLQKLVAIKNSHDSSPGKLKASKAAATVLSNMFQYKKLHKDYKQVRNTPGER
uniref:Plakophilin 3 n=1 Tax=Oncorhynchus mykiss TaxID=8022 RepID=A0A8C7LWJ2_ONCMY